MTTGPSTSAIRRLTAAFLALLIAMPALAVIAQPASAHRQTTQRCDYDPISGQSFNCRQVPVSHTHPKPKPEPTCPAGTTGSPPNCSPIPSDNTNHAGDSDGSEESDDSDDSDGGDGDADDNRGAQNGNGDSDGPFGGSQEENPTEENINSENNQNHDSGSNQRDEGISQQNSGNGDSDGPFGGSQEQNPTEENINSENNQNHDSGSNQPDGDSGDGSAEEDEDHSDEGCPSGTFVSGGCEPRPQGSPSGSDAEPAADDDESEEAGEGDEEASEEGENDNCSTAGQHRHENLWGILSDCHDSIPGHAHADGSKDKPCENGFFWNGSECEERADPELVRRGANLYYEVSGEILCTWAAGGLAARITNRVLKGVSEAAKRVFGGAAEVHLESPCDDIWEAMQDWIMNNDGEREGSNGDDSSDQSGNDETTEEVVKPVQTPDTTTQTEPAESASDDQQDDGDAAANSETEPSTTTTTPPVAVGPVTGLGGSADGNSVWLGWNVPATGPAPTAYRVLRSSAGGAEQEVARVGGNAYFDRSLQPGVTYTYRVQAISGSLSGPISASASVTIR